MSDDLVLGIDCSTTAVKAVVWDMTGRAISSGRATLALHVPQSGWGEQNPSDWWQALLIAIGKACQQIDSSRIRGLAITHQRETFACLDSQGQAIRPAMLWLDNRAAQEVKEFGTPHVHRITGKTPNTATGWYKMLWLGRHEPRTLAATVKLVDVHGYLVQRLTGEWVTSYGSTDSLGVLDLKNFCLSAELIEVAGLRATNFSMVHAPGHVLGTLKRDIAELLGLPYGLKVIAGLGDGQAAGLGTGIIRSGEAYISLGTGIVSGIFSADYRIDNAFRTMTGGLAGSYILESFFGGGIYNISWFVNKFSDIGAKPFALDLIPEQIFETAAATLPAGSEGLLALPYLTGVLTPYWDSNARGVFFGLNAQHGKAHMYRAILEGLAFEQRLSTSHIEAASGSEIKMFHAVGGGTRSILWCQMIADIFGRPLAITREAEATCLGAAMLAAHGIGYYKNIAQAVEAMSATGKIYEPDPQQHARYDQFYDLYKELYPTLKKHFSRLHDVMSTSLSPYLTSVMDE